MNNYEKKKKGLATKAKFSEKLKGVSNLEALRKTSTSKKLKANE